MAKGHLCVMWVLYGDDKHDEEMAFGHDKQAKKSYYLNGIPFTFLPIA